MARRRKKRKSRHSKKRFAKLRRKIAHRRAPGRRAPGLSAAQIQEHAAWLKKQEEEYEKFNAARTAIAHRLGVSPGHAQAHYQALIEYAGMSPEKAEEATWGFQP